MFVDDEFSGILNVADQEVTPHKDYITIGLVGKYWRLNILPHIMIWFLISMWHPGHPNVGKSSLINSIMGRTVVSASRTPGTDHVHRQLFINSIQTLTLHRL